MRSGQGISITKRILPVIPYVVLFYVADKLAWLFHYCRGPNLISRILVLLQNYKLAFSDLQPSWQLMDLEAGSNRIDHKTDRAASQEKCKKIPTRYRIWFCKVGNTTRYCTLHGPEI